MLQNFTTARNDFLGGEQGERKVKANEMKNKK